VLADRILAIDYGTVRVGLAISDPLGLTAQSLKYIRNNSDLWGALKTVLDEYSVSKVVLGLPKTMKGTDSHMTQEVRDFASSFQKRFNVDIIFRDERLSSKAAEAHLISADVKRKKRKDAVDSLAAAFILQGYLDEL